jgi:putative ABC transport system substrate-binding protein
MAEYASLLRRRDLLARLGGAALLAPASVKAQPAKPRLAILAPTPADTPAAFWQAFWEGMRALGYSRDAFEIEARWADGHPERLPGFAAELVQLKPQIIVCFGSEAGVAAKRASSAIPIVLAVSSDPIAAGLVATLGRPGGNVTGLSLAAPDLAGKHVELLRTLLSPVQQIAILLNPHDPTHAGRAAAITQAAQSVQIEASSVAAASVDQIAGAFAEISRLKPQALIVLGTPIFQASASTLNELAIRSHLPVMCDNAGTVRLGVGVMGYGADLTDLFRRAASYVDQILKGAKPADLPVQQPTKFELVINSKNAKTLGLTVPQSLLARADEVIE